MTDPASPAPDLSSTGRLILAGLLAAGLAACGTATHRGGGDSYAAQLAFQHRDDRPVASPAVRSGQEAPGREVAYGKQGGTELTGYFAAPEGAGADLPGVVVIHEWWGLNDQIRAMTRKLAAQGYAALAVDLYGDRVAEEPGRARELTSSVMQDPEAARQNLRAAYRWLVERGAPRVGVIGWCFGGSWSLQTALALPDQIDAAVMYYGRPVTDAERLEELSMPLQGHFGAEDGSIPVKQVKAFEQALGEAGVASQIYVYDGAGHAFANPSGGRYVEAAAEEAWERTTAFFEEHLKGAGGGM